MDIPSYRVKPGQIISIVPKMRENPIVLDALDQNVRVPPYLSFDRASFSGRMIATRSATTSRFRWTSGSSSSTTHVASELPLILLKT